MKTRVLLPSLLLLLLPPSPSDAGNLAGGTHHAGSLDGLSIEADSQYGFVQGSTRVREWDITGDRFEFGRDLGIESAFIPGITLSYGFLGKNRIYTNVDYFFMEGSNSRLRKDLTFNGATLARETALDTFPEILILSAGYEREIYDLGGLGSLSLFGGVQYDWINFVMKGTLAEDTFGDETEEDFYAQTLPLPFLGAHLSARLTGWADLGVSVAGFKAKGWNSLRKEVGTVYLSQENLEASAEVLFHGWEGLHMALGWRYLHIAQSETSTEDGNVIGLDIHGPTLALSYRF